MLLSLSLSCAAWAARPGLQAPSRWLVIDRVDARGRRPFRPDAVFDRYLLDRTAPAPSAGERVSGEVGESVWEWRSVDENGRVPDRPGWAYAELELDQPTVALAHLVGAATLWVNGDPAVGDPYAYSGWGGVPVALRAGSNSVFVSGVRSPFRLELEPAPAGLLACAWDLTRPDVVGDEPLLAELGVLVLNASQRPRSALEYSVSGPGLARVEGVVAADLTPLGLTKLPFPLRVAQPAAADPLRARIHLRDPETGESASLEIALARRSRDEATRRTFRSAVDDSVQEWSLRWPAPSERPARSLALVLSLHGAGVDARGQAESYARSPRHWLAAPTNRRPFGFDWQDWGRDDAYEVLAEAVALSGVSPARVSLTGHSMGGHGTWHLAANDPDRFAAIGPSAGWRSFDSYVGRPEGALSTWWHAADAASRSEDLISNLAQLPTFILHGTADDNVPVSEARAMEEALRAAGGDVRAHYQDGAGHWWDAPGPGVACVDWPEMMALLDRSRVPLQPTSIDWTSVSPAVDAEHHGLVVEQVLEWGRPFRVRGRVDAGTLRLETENVRRLFVPWRPDVTALVVDGLELGRASGAQPEGGDDVRLVRGPEGWREASAPAPVGEKRPGRAGPFKQAFRRGFVLVVGTGGDPSYSRELWARARMDAEAWWYRGNGRAPILSDRAFLERRPRLGGHSVILYGNRDANAAFDVLLGPDYPIDVRAGRVRVGQRVWTGGDLACVAVAPRADDPEGSVGLVASSGLAGARLEALLATFVSGVGYPDYVVWDRTVLAEGDGGVLATGWLDSRWQLQPGGFRAAPR